MVTDSNGKRNIAANMRQLMADTGLKQSDIARATGENRMTISNIARGAKMPGAALLSRVAEALGVTSDDLLAEPQKKLAVSRK